MFGRLVGATHIAGGKLMAGFMAENWQKIGSVTADDMAMKIWYSVIVQNWAMAVRRFRREWQQFASGAAFCCQISYERRIPIWRKIKRSRGNLYPRGFNAGFKGRQAPAI